MRSGKTNIDREKVIKGLEVCSTGKCEGCPYLRTPRCTLQILEDALALLKEQEAVKPTKSPLSMSHGFMWDIYDCGFCGNQLREFAKYCDQCGKAVKWDG